MGLQETLDDYENYLKVSTTSAITTITRYRNIVRLLLLDLKLDLTLKRINKWVAMKNRKYSTYAYKYAVKHFLVSIGRHDWADQIVKSKKQKRKKVFRFIPKSKMQSILNMLSPFNKRLAFMQLKTGARFSEVAAIRVENIDFFLHEHLIYITIGAGKSLSKGSKERKLRLSKKYEPMLKSWIQKPYGYLFLKPKWETMPDEKVITHIDNLRRYLCKDLAKAGKFHGIDGLSSHYLRHLFADYFLISSKNNSFALKSILGHSDLKTTESYISVEDKMVDNFLINMEDD